MSRVTSSTLSKNHICSTFRKQAFSTWNLLRKSRVNDFQPGEETITDMNLLEIKMKHPQEVFIQKFTKRQEAKTGADWEWWFTGSSGKWLGFRIQAKVINIDTLSFPHLYYKSSRIYQTDKLIQDAFKERPHKIPLYCLYTNWNTQSMSYPWHCYSFKKSAKSYGCSILPAFWVKYLLQEGKQPTLKSVIPYMFPWQCLICFMSVWDFDLPHRALMFWHIQILNKKKLSNGILTNSEFRKFREIYLTNEAPLHVQTLLDKGKIKESPDDPSLRGILVIREKEDINENKYREE